MSPPSLLRSVVVMALGMAISCSTPPTSQTEIHVATFNVHNLFDDVPDGTEEVVDRSAYKTHVAALAAVLDELDADILVLQEVENQRALDDLANAAARAGPYPERVLLPGNDPRGIHVAALSRLTFDEIVSHRDDLLPSPSGNFFYHYARDCLELHLSETGHPLVLFGVHFKSKADPDNPDKRLAEAEHTRELADAAQHLDPLAGILVLGDFNDVPGSAPVDAVVAPQGRPQYVDLAVRASAHASTTEFNGRPELLDHVVADPMLAAEVVPDGVMILHDDAVQRASDHAPIAVTFRLR